MYHDCCQQKQGYGIVVVVSAMGRKTDPYATDTFIHLLKESSQNPSLREMDLLMSCGEVISGTLLTVQLNASGVEAYFF